MIFRPLFDSTSGTYTYLLASRHGGEALIIDPVLERVDRYLQLVRELDLKLVKAVDTHLHADHVTGLGALRDHTHCIAKYVLTPAAMDLAKKELHARWLNRSPEFANAREVRNFFERIISEQSNRVAALAAPSTEMLSTVEEADVLAAS